MEAYSTRRGIIELKVSSYRRVNFVRPGRWFVLPRQSLSFLLFLSPNDTLRSCSLRFFQLVHSIYSVLTFVGNFAKIIPPCSFIHVFRNLSRSLSVV